MGFYKGSGGVVWEIDEPTNPHRLGHLQDQIARGDLSPCDKDGNVAARAEPEADKVPTIDEVKAEVGDDPEKAAAALEVESAREKPRKTLLEHLHSLIGGD